MFRRFFTDLDSIFAFLAGLRQVACPRCHHVGALKRHGTLVGFVSPSKQGIRAWRIYCNPKRGGCGHAPSVRIGNTLHHRCISTHTLWSFLHQWTKEKHVRLACERAGWPLSIDAAFRLLRGLRNALSFLRSILSARAPPDLTKIGARNPSVQTLCVLRSVFGAEDPIRAYQQGVQTPFPVR